MERSNAMKELDRSIADLYSTGDLNLAEQQLTLQQQGLADYQNIFAQKAAQDNWLKQYQQQNQDAERQRLIEQIPAHYEDYTAYINELQNDGDSSNDWLIPYVQMQKNDKVANMQAAEAAAAQQAFENQMLYDKTGTGSGRGSKTETYKPRLSASQAMSEYSDGVRTSEVAEAMRFYYGINIGSKAGRETTKNIQSIW